MKRIVRTMCVLSLLAVLSESAAGQHVFERHFGGEQYDNGSDVLEMPGGGFLLIGTTRSVSNDTTDAWVIRTDERGDPIWTNVYGGSRFDSGISLLPASDDGYILALTTNSFGSSYDIGLVRIDATGTVDWLKTYGGSLTENVHDLAPTEDGGYVAIAHAMSPGRSGLDFYLLRVAQNGDSLWARTYGGDEWDWGGSVQQTSDGGYIMAGDTKSFGDDLADAYLVRTDAAGDTLWTRTFGETGIPERAVAVLQAADGGYLLAIETIGGVSVAAGETIISKIIKTDATGAVQWSTVLHGGTMSTPANVRELDNGDFMAVGDAYRGDKKGIDAYAIRFDRDGSVVSEWYFGGLGYDGFTAVQQTADGGFVFVGTTESFAPGMGMQVYLVKTDADGTVTGVHDDAAALRPRTVRLEGNYPNPFNPATSIRFELPQAMRVTLTVHDLYGRTVRQLLDGAPREAGSHRIAFDAAGLPSGVYFYSLIADGRRLTGKMMLLR